MELFHVQFLFLLSFSLYLTDVYSNELCESCKPIEDCPRFTEMSKQLQQKWRRDFTCKGFIDNDKNPLPGFSSVDKGDHVCCPNAAIWGITDNDNLNTEPEDRLIPHSYKNMQHPPITSTPHYNRDYGDSNYGYDYNNYGYDDNNYDYGNNNYDYGDDKKGNGQCAPNSTQPEPESKCCGVDMSDGDSLTDVQQYLEDMTSNSYWSNFYKRRRRSLDAIPEDEDELEDRIAGGQETDLDQYPWTAFLTITFRNGVKSSTFNCGGSLISSNFILTAAHCVVHENQNIIELEVTLGEYDKRSFPLDCINNGQHKTCTENLKIPAANVILHPEYDDKYLINDIALIKLQDTAPYTKYIRPVCLPPFNVGTRDFANLPLAISGWGMNVTVYSNIKQFAIVRMVPYNRCREYYPHLTDGHICASGKRKEDVCRGDSGGPLMMLYRERYYVVGIVSGKSARFQCGTPVPSLYTNVYTYLDWIRMYVQ